MNLKDFASKQMTGIEQFSIKVDLDGAVERLAKGVSHNTISYQDREDFDTEACLGYRKHL